MKSILKIIQQCETDLRSGQAQNIQARLKSLNSAKIPREFQLPLANIARRAGLFLLGLKILNGAVRKRIDATPNELAEYAVLLQKTGAVEEAGELLALVNKESAPIGHLYQAFQCFHEWDGPGAIPHLKSFLESDISEYDRAVGRTNLAAALLQAGEIDNAELVLRQDLILNRSRGYVRLECNSCELLAQALLQQSEFEAAKIMIERAHSLLSNEQSPDIQFVQKWMSVIEAHEKRSVEPLQTLRADALKRQDWEIVRDADLFSCKIKFSRESFERLYFGTPYPLYRARILKTLNMSESDVGATYNYVLSQPAEATFVLASGELVKDGEAESIIEPGSKTHQVLGALLMDLYRPLRVGGIFAHLFPEEVFDPFESPDRVHRLIARTRKVFTEMAVPLKILHHEESYQIQPSEKLGIELLRDRQIVERNGALLARLCSQFRSEGFSPKQAIEFLGVSASTFKRLASWGIKNRKLDKIGAGSAVVYRVA